MSVAEKLTAIADAIRTYAREPLGKLTLDDMAKNIPTIYNIGVEDGEPLGFEQGKKDAYDEFWDIFQQNGTRTDYVSAFGSQWTLEIFKPKYQIQPLKAAYMFFNNNGNYLKILDFVEFADNLAREQGKTPQTHPDMFDENGHYNLIDLSNCDNLSYGLAGLHSNHFGTLNLINCTNTSYLFYTHNYGSTSPVKKIDKLISSEKTVFATPTFQNATYLEDITMDGVVAKSIDFGACPLNKASIISVVNVLSSSTTGQTVTFKKTAVNTAFGINVDDTSTYPVGSEFYNLRNSKPNWTFSYA